MDEQELIQAIEKCIRISQQFDEQYRSLILEVLLHVELDGRVEHSRVEPIGNEDPSRDQSDEQNDSARNPGIQKLCSVLGLSVEEVERIYRFGPEAPEIIGYDPHASRSQAEAVRELCALYMLALDVVYGKQVAKLDELRQLVTDWRLYNSGNFAGNHIGKSAWFTRRGDEVRLSYSARQEIIQICMRILGKTSQG